MDPKQLAAQKKALQQKMKGLLTEAETLRSRNAQKGQWDPTDAASYEKLIKEAGELKLTLVLLNQEEEILDWAHSGDGKGAVLGSFGSGDEEPSADDEMKTWRYSGPIEGAKSGLTLDKGKVVAMNKAGEAKLKVLASGAYKDALNEYLRNAFKPGYTMKAQSMKVLQEGLDASGGAWVVPEFRNELVKKEAAMATIRPNARAFPVGSNLVVFPKVVYTTDDRYTSGVRFAWTAEAPSANISEATNPVAGNTEIPVHTAMAAILMSRQQMEDNEFDLIGFCNELLSEAFVLGENDVFVTGDGVGKPQGFTQHPKAAVAHASGGMLVLSGAAGAVAWGGETTGIIGTEAALPEQYEANAKWYARKRTYAAIRSLNAGTANQPVWSLGDAYPNAANGMTPTLLGYPIVRESGMPAVGATSTPLAFGDMQGYWIADRVGITIDILRELFALRGLVCIVAYKRVGAQLVHDWRLKLLKSNNT